MALMKCITNKTITLLSETTQSPSEQLMVKENKGRMLSEGTLSHPPSSFMRHFLLPESPNKKPPLDLQVSYQKANNHFERKYENVGKGRRRMIVTTKKLLIALFFIISAISLLRLLRMTANTSSSSSSPTLLQALTSSAPYSHIYQATSSSVAANLTAKELQLLSDIVSVKTPCNLLVFGLGPQYLGLSLLNAGGTTIFLEDNNEILRTIRTNSTGTRIYKVEHNAEARQAYKLLKHARDDPACALEARLLQSNCQLALKQLPTEVYELKWDVIVVDGPSADRPDAPGRMSALYTAAMLARVGNMTDVLVHDVDRIIEKWFSWEFLCEENLVSSKGKLWHFSIRGDSNSMRFCSIESVQIV